MDYPWAIVGAKVVCIKRGPWRHDGNEAAPALPYGPEFGERLTVAWVGVLKGKVHLKFAEREWMDGLAACAFEAKQFRPAASTDGGMAVLRRAADDAHRVGSAPPDYGSDEEHERETERA